MGRERLKEYCLLGSADQVKQRAELADGSWFRVHIPRNRMKKLMRRSDHYALRDTAIWLGGMVITGAAGVYFWGSWIAFPFFLMYGVLYGSASDSRWHETGHRTAFKTQRMNDVVYQIASFFMIRNPTVWRWQHTRHHTDTLIVGRDPEIITMRPARLLRICANFFGLVDVPMGLRNMLLHTAGHLTSEENTYVPDTERKRVFFVARIWLAIYVTTLFACIIGSSLLPIMLVGGPRLYGTFLHLVYALTQHSGLGEDVLDHRLNTRTVYMNRINRFLYWNMNYHVEHHMFPLVPYHKLSELHEEIKHELASPYPSIFAAYKEIIPAIVRQLKDQTYYIRRELPPEATSK